MEAATDSMGPLHLPELQETLKGSFTVKEETPPWIGAARGSQNSMENSGSGGEGITLAPGG